MLHNKTNKANKRSGRPATPVFCEVKKKKVFEDSVDELDIKASV